MRCFFGGGKSISDSCRGRTRPACSSIYGLKKIGRGRRLRSRRFITKQGTTTASAVLSTNMAPVKKSSAKSPSSSVSLKKIKGENFYRNAKQVARLKLLTGGKPIRDKDGNIIQAAAFQKGESETKPGRVQPDRRWFGECYFTRYLVKCERAHLGNTRVISQTALEHFRTSLSTKKDDPYSVLLRRNKLPMALLDDAVNPNLRKVNTFIGGNTRYLARLFSGHTSSRRNHFRKHLDPRLSARNLGLTRTLLRSSEKLVPSQRRKHWRRRMKQGQAWKVRRRNILVHSR